MRQQFSDNDPHSVPRNQSRTATHRGPNSVLVETSDNPVTDTNARLRSSPPGHREFQSKTCSADTAALGDVLLSLKRGGAEAGQILGDWQLNVIASFLDGTPLDVTSGTNPAGLAANFPHLGQRPDLVPGVPIYLHIAGDPLQYLNPAAFSLPAVGQFGNLGRGAIRGPGSKNIDLSVVKNCTLTPP